MLKKVIVVGLDENEKKQLRENAQEIYTELSIKFGGGFDYSTEEETLDILGKYVPSIEKNKDAILDMESDELSDFMNDIQNIVEEHLPEWKLEITLKDYAKYFKGKELVEKLSDYLYGNVTSTQIAKIIVKNNLLDYFGNL